MTKQEKDRIINKIKDSLAAMQNMNIKNEGSFIANRIIKFLEDETKGCCVTCGSRENGFYRRHLECKSCYNLKVYAKKTAIANKHGFKTYYQFLKHTDYKKIL